MMDVMKITPIEKAIGLYPTLGSFAAAVGVSYQVVQKWRKTGVPPKHCASVELATKGVVTRSQLRPEIFGAIPVASRRKKKSVSSKAPVRQ